MNIDTRNHKICSKQFNDQCVKSGSADLFVTRSRVCLNCRKSINNSYYAKNKEQLNERAKKLSYIKYHSNEAHKQQKIDKSKQYYKNNKPTVDTEVEEGL
jgi:hypothetical protein